MAQIILLGKWQYTVGKELGGNKRFRLYRATSDGLPGKEFILKIATSVAENGTLDREAFLLSCLLEESNNLEAEYASLTEGKGSLNYQIGFPNLVETFLAETQERRRVLVLSFPVTECISDLASLSMIRDREHKRIDPKTSVWILGKLLKILGFAHSQCIANGNVSAKNILIERDQHAVTIFDWSSAVTHAGGIPKGIARAEIENATREVVRTLGGNASSGEIPMDEQLTDGSYQAILQSFVRGVYSDANKAHSDFYEVVEKLWARKFHKFASYPLN